MHDNRLLVEERIEKLRERLSPLCDTVLTTLDVAAWHAPGEPVDFAVAKTAAYSPFPKGTWWGPAWSTWWLRLTGQVPPEATGLAIDLHIDLGFVGDWAGNQSEGMVFTVDGWPVKAVNPMNRTVPLTGGPLADRALREGHPLVSHDGVVDLFVEAAANPNLTDHLGSSTPQGDRLTASADPVWKFGGAELATRNEDVWALALDLEVLDGMMRQLPEHSTRRATILRGLERAADIIDSGEPRAMADAARQALAPLIASGANASAQHMTAIGHAHIDSAWLWPIRETRRKVLRTFSNVTALAEQYPEFHFACTSAQHYQWLKEASPQVYARVLEAIRRGQWHPVGGMWVESDTNLPGGEALARQLTTGLRWMRDELGVRPDCLWLPDSFGYTGALPQLARLAGMRWFFTQKLSWNQTNQIPHHTFWWEGIDGTRIWTHFPPVDCYDSIVSPDEVVRAERNFKEKGMTRRSLLPFGYGDGGGGPIPEMVERIRRLGDFEDAPVVASGSPADFFEAARAEYPDPPVWAGELYLEFHRGVYTTQLQLKQGNRRGEHALAALELLATLAHCENPGYAYPRSELEELWRRVLLLQFHDILPGSSTAWVNREAAAEYRALAHELDVLTSSAWEALRTDHAATSVLNAAPFRRREVVYLGDGLRLVDVPAHATTAVDACTVTPEHPVSVRRGADGIGLDNGLVSVQIAHDGTVASITDLTRQREVLLTGRHGNVLRLHPDHPSSFDAWELQEQYRRQGTDLLEVSTLDVVTDPLRARINVTRDFGSSKAVQSITLDADSRTIGFELWVDWREREHVLKVRFPLAVRATRAMAEIQFGHIERPIAVNTSWDAARFETSGHRWLLLAEPGYGIALSNDSSYGHDVVSSGGSPEAAASGVEASLTLLRAPQAPDPYADLGEHTVRYALTLDAGIQVASEAGVSLNQPLRMLPGTGPAGSFALVDADDDHSFAVIDAVKASFEDSDDIVIRLHEAAGARSRVTLRVAVAAAAVEEVDLLEDRVADPSQTLPCGPLAAHAPLHLALRPFQILTLRFRRALP